MRLVAPAAPAPAAKAAVRLRSAPRTSSARAAPPPAHAPPRGTRDTALSAVLRERALGCVANHRPVGERVGEGEPELDQVRSSPNRSLREPGASGPAIR